MRFKELYNKARQEQKFSLDEASMWDNIESSLDQPKKKRRFFWLWLSGGILFCGACLYFFQGSDSLIKENVLLIESSTDLFESSLEKPTLEKMNPKSYREENNTQEEKELEAAIIYEQSPFKSNLSKAVNDSKKHNLKESSAFDVTKEVVFYNNKAKSNATSNTSAANQNPKQYLDENKPRLTINLLPPIPFVRLIDNELQNTFDSISIHHSIPKLPNLLPTENTIVKEKLHLEFSFHYLFPESTISEKNLQVPTWAALHSSSKSKSTSFQFSTMLKYQDSSGFGLGVGVLYRQISEWYDGTKTEITAIEMPSDSASFASIDGFKVYKSGSLTGSIIQNTNYHTPIRRRYFDIPVEVSYNRSFGQLDFELFLAYNFNITHNYSGRTYDESQILLEQDQLDLKNIYKNKFVNSTNVGLKINHHITSNTSIGLSLSYWKQMSSSLSKQNSIEEYYKGLAVGISCQKSLR